jgi:hypothetical protein
MAKVEEIRKKIQARRAEKLAAKKAKWAKMRSAASDPGRIEKHLTVLAQRSAAMSDGFENLKANLGLVRAPRQASLSVRVAAAKNYAKSFKRIAEEAPEQLEEAVREAYKSLDEIAGALEMAADDLGVDLEPTPVEEEFADEGKLELEHGEEEGEEIVEEEHGEDELKEAAGSDWFVTDRGADGKPEAPEDIEVPRVANSGPGSQGFVTDRDKGGKPEAPSKLKVPQARGGDAQTSIKDASGKRGKQRPLTQIVPGGTPAGLPAEDFVRDIPQAQGASESPGNKAAAARRRN